MINDIIIAELVAELSIIWCAPIIIGKPKGAILLKFVVLSSARVKGFEGLSRFDNCVRKKENPIFKIVQLCSSVMNNTVNKTH